MHLLKLYTPHCPKILHHPQVLWVGIGCNKGTSKQLIQAAIQQVLRENKLAECAIAGIATIDIKANEAGLIELCRERNLPLKTFSADILRTVCVPNSNVVVAKQLGTPSVAEAAALCAIWQCVGEAALAPAHEATAAQRHSELPCKEEDAKPTLIVPKQIFRSDGEGAVTVAVAEALTKPRWGGVWGVGCRVRNSPNNQWDTTKSFKTIALVGVSSPDQCCVPYTLHPTPYTLLLDYSTVLSK